MPKNKSENYGNDRKDQLTIRWAGAEGKKKDVLLPKPILSTSGGFLSPSKSWVEFHFVAHMALFVVNSPLSPLLLVAPDG